MLARFDGRMKSPWATVPTANRSRRLSGEALELESLSRHDLAFIGRACLLQNHMPRPGPAPHDPIAAICLWSGFNLFTAA